MNSFRPRIGECRHYFLFLIIGLVVVARIGAAAVLYAKNVFPSPIQDPLEYRNLAMNILAGNGFSIAQNPPYPPDLFRTPLYPLFLAATYGIDSAGYLAILLQQLMIIASAWLLFKILRRWNDSSGKIALIFSLFLLVDPRIWFWSLETMTEALFIFLTAAMLFLLLYPENFNTAHVAGAAVFFGLAVLTRPSGLLWAPGLVLFFLFCKKPVKSRLFMFFIFMAVAGIVVSPWLWRNYKLVGRPILSSMQTVNYIQAFGIGRDDPSWRCSDSIVDSKGREGCVFYGWTAAGFSDAEKTARNLRANTPVFSLIKKNMTGAYHFWKSNDYPDALSILRSAALGAGKPISRTWQILAEASHKTYAAFLNFMLILGVAGLVFLYKKRELAAAGLLGGIIFSSVFINFGLASGRLHLILLPPLFYLAGLGTVFIKQIYQQ
ncbi:MAG: glycosyltransferase family 39 protein [Patescibacteria group bacterium]